MITLRAYADYVCPWCYIGQNSAERFKKEFGVEVEWEPYLLRPDAPDKGWAIPEHIKAKMNRPDNPLQARAKELGITMVEREWIPSSRLALECNEFIRPFGIEKLDAFHNAVNARYWTKGEDLSDWKVLEAAANDVGLDGAAMREKVSSGAFKKTVAERIEEAQKLGVNAVPTYVFLKDGEPVFGIQGAQEYPAFLKAAERLGLQK
jgi:predicted DsbA family dithiol-disulfide isomerase